MEHLISETRTKLLAVRAENRTVAAAFELSYQYLPERRRQFFRRLGLHPGTTIDIWAAATLTGVALSEADEELDALHGEGFLIETGHRRYGMHDLIREYARDLAAADSRSDRRAALDRLAHSCYGFVNFAFNQLNNGNPMVDIGFLEVWLASGMPGVGAVEEIFEKAGSATAWFREQIANLIAVTRTAHEQGLAITARLACGMFYLLEIGGYFEEWREIEEIGKLAATSMLDRARSLRNRGRLELVRVLEAQERLYDDDDPRPSPASACSAAIPLLEESRDLYRACADQNGEGTALRELADALRLEAEPDDPESIDRAVAGYREAERVYRAMDNQNAVASLTQAMGITYARGRRYTQAESCFLESLAYASVEVRGKARHGRLKAYSLRRLADLYRDLGDLDKSVWQYEKCIVAFEVDVDDPIARARALSYCGRTHADRNQVADARYCLSKAVELFATRPLGYDDPEAKVAGAWLKRLTHSEDG
jgi:tetratricopeptide (TPR) repeat protein